MSYRDNAMTSSIRIVQVFPELVGRKTRAAYIINYALYLAHYDAYFDINDDAKKCGYLSITNNLIFSHYSFKFLSHEVLLEECFAMDTLIIFFSN